MKNIILKTTAYIMFAVAWISAAMLDSDTCIPTIIFIISVSWLALFAYANGKMKILEDFEDADGR